MSHNLTLTVTKRKFYNLLTSLGYDLDDFDNCFFFKAKGYDNRYYFSSILSDFLLYFFSGDVILYCFFDGRFDTFFKLNHDQIERFKLVKFS